MQPKAKIQSVNLNLWYGDFHALKDVSMTIRPQAITAIIGPSGCGKSTLLRCFNRMNDLTPTVRTSGQILLDGQDINAAGYELTKLRKRVGMVFQKSNPFPKSIYENIAYGLRVAGIKKKEVIDEVVE